MDKRRRVAGRARVEGFGRPWLVAALAIAFCTGAVAADHDWSTVVLYRGADEPVPPPPVPAVRPTLLPPVARAELLPKSAYAQSEDQRERQLLNGKPRQAPLLLSPIETSATPAKAAPAAASAPASGQTAPRPRGEPPPEDATRGQQYCFNIADAAADARFAWQQKTLAEIESELDKRVALLEEKTREYRTWLARRQAFADKAQDSLVKIYARMGADAAAQQIAALDEETGAALVVKLDPRVASAIMAEMDPQHAARLSATIAGAARTGDSREQAAANARALQSEPKQ